MKTIDDYVDPVTNGEKRKWLKCKTCGRIYYHDYIPYSLASPIMWLTCGHSAGISVSEATEIVSENEALVYFIERDTEKKCRKKKKTYMRSH